MTIDDFNKSIKRHQAFKEYAQAFNLCLKCIENGELRQNAIETGETLIKEHGYEVLGMSGSKRIITVSLDLNLEWIVDSAISLGYKELEHGSISTGLFSSCPCVIVGSLLSKQKFGLIKNKDNTTSLLYSFGSFTSDYKLIKTLCFSLIEQLNNKYNGL